MTRIRRRIDMNNEKEIKDKLLKIFEDDLEVVVG